MPMYMAPSIEQPLGLLEPGNLDIRELPAMTAVGEEPSPRRAMMVEVDGKHILLPTVGPAGDLFSEDEAIQHYTTTGDHLGMFDSIQGAAIYSEILNNDFAHGLVPTSDTPPAINRL